MTLILLDGLAVADALAAQLTQVACACLALEGVTLPCYATLTLTDDAGIRDINRMRRGMDKATDVLSFPSIPYASGHTARMAEDRLQRCWDPDERAAHIGDIVISLERAAEQALTYGHPEAREICYLLAHGMFHLMGYDHTTKEEQDIMRNMEEAALVEARTGNLVTDEELLQLAREAMQRSYSPYSHYKVGACLLAADGRTYQGSNIENASYGLTNCAERTAVFNAVHSGARDFMAIAIAAEKSAPWPCGACRQVLSEFCTDLRVLVTWGDGQTDHSTLQELLPHSFSPASGIQDILGKE